LNSPTQARACAVRLIANQPDQLPGHRLIVSQFRSLVLAAVVLFANPATAQEREWTLDETDQDAFLVFGTPGTDDVGASFWCGIGSRRVRFYLPVPGHAKITKMNSKLIFEVDLEVFTASAKSTSDANVPGDTLEAEFDTGDRLFSALDKASYFSVRSGQLERSFPLAEADIDGLLRRCRMAKPDSR
jgi:hypothetical protein